jgi:hypothetical protein
MGIIYSQVQFNVEREREENGNSNELISVSNEKLRLSFNIVKDVINKYNKHKYPPIVSYIDLHGFIYNCIGSGQQDITDVLWQMFSLQTMYVYLL